MRAKRQKKEEALSFDESEETLELDGGQKAKQQLRRVPTEEEAMQIIGTKLCGIPKHRLDSARNKKGQRV